MHSEQPFAILQPARVPELPDQMEIFTDVDSLPELPGITEATWVALDYETMGTDWSPAGTSHCRPVGVALSWDWDGQSWAAYIELTESNMLQVHADLRELKLPLIGHNIFYDGGWYSVFTPTREQWPWVACTYSALRYLATEDFEGQRWGLKWAQLYLMGWTSSGDVELDQWLIDNGYAKWMESTQKWKIDKSQMWRAPASILGHYGALDAYSTLRLWTDVLLPAREIVGDELFTFLSEVQVPLIKYQIDAHHSGIPTDKLHVEKTLRGVEADIERIESEFREMYASQIEEIIRRKTDEKYPEVEKWEPRKVTKPPKAKLPKTEDGKLAESWIKYIQTMIDLQNNPTQISQKWRNRELKREACLRGEVKTCGFNIGSKLDLKTLFFDLLGVQYIDRGDVITIHGVPLNKTDSGELPMNKSVYGLLGEGGKLLAEYAKAVKLRGYIQSALDRVTSQRDGDSLPRIHVDYIIPGTVSGRPAGTGGLNFLQIPKHRPYLEAFRPEPGRVWLDCDIASVEPVILTEYSRDRGLMDVYSRTDVGNCIYLYFGAHTTVFGKDIRSAGYDPDNPTDEGVAAAKKKCKLIRSICKSVVLAQNYGAGVPKIYQTLRIAGIEITQEEVALLVADYKRTFAGILQFRTKLEREWDARVRDGFNSGWIWDGLGHPAGVAERYRKDLVNRHIQKTAHGVHMLIVHLFAQVAEAEGLEFEWVVVDFYDQFIVDIDETDSKLALYCVEEAYRVVNEILGGVLPIRGDPQLVHSLAEAKCE